MALAGHSPQDASPTGVPGTPAREHGELSMEAYEENLVVKERSSPFPWPMVLQPEDPQGDSLQTQLPRTSPIHGDRLGPEKYFYKRAPRRV